MQISPIRLFVAARIQDVPKDVHRYASVDGVVPGATWVWDHHQSGEPINLDVLPEHFDPEVLDGLASTHVDSDGILSAVTVLLGGKAHLTPEQRALFATACHYCDHLTPHPDYDAEANARGERLHRAIMHGLSRIQGRSARFEQRVCDLFARIQAGEPLPERDPAEDYDPDLARTLRAQGRIRRVGDVALVDLSGLHHPDVWSVYAAHGAPVGVHYDRHRDGGFVYSVGINPVGGRKLRDLRPVLKKVAAREYAFGPPTLSPDPGELNWGGRAEVFGSPWNYGSRIAPEQLGKIIQEALAAGDAK